MSSMKSFVVALSLSLISCVSSRPAPQTSSFALSNGEAAIQLNQQFATLTADSSCTEGENACVNDEFAQCVNGQFVLQSCGSGEICAALPLVNSAGTSITCTTQSDLDARIAATGATSAAADAASGSSTVASSSTVAAASASSSSIAASKTTASSSVSTATRSSTLTASAATSSSSGDLQSSLCLDSSLLQTGFEEDGQQTPAAGQVASLTSKNNFINFCATVNVGLTNGQQVKGGSCNAAPMGVIASTSNMPSAKFQSPKNLDTIKANTTFTVNLGISNLATGNFVNADTNYFSAPQQVDSSGNIIGHSHIVIQAINGLSDTTVPDASDFAFFKGLNSAAVDGVLSADVTDGLAAGTYRMATINSAANHQPVLVAVAQHASLDDIIYFTVSEDGT